LRLILDGALGSAGGLSSTLMVWVPLLLAAAGLVVTFGAGLWNIGIEGQLVMGAVAGALVARTVHGGSGLVIPLVALAGMLGGRCLLVGVLRTSGRVNEIFGGLGLDFVATGLVVYLVIGPWKRVGSASTSGTDLFPREAWLPGTGSLTASWVALALAATAVIVVYFLMKGTYFGLRLRAVGRNRTPLMGISATATAGCLHGVWHVVGPAGVAATGFHQAGALGVGVRPSASWWSCSLLGRLDRLIAILRGHLGREHPAAIAAGARPAWAGVQGVLVFHPARRRLAAAVGLPEPAHRKVERWMRLWLHRRRRSPLVCAVVRRPSPKAGIINLSSTAPSCCRRWPGSPPHPSVLLGFVAAMLVSMAVALLIAFASSNCA
jgi:ABC-type uncharacterized transport system permease subunit